MTYLMWPEKRVVQLQSSHDLCDRKRAKSGVVQCFISPDNQLGEASKRVLPVSYSRVR